MATSLIDAISGEPRHCVIGLMMDTYRDTIMRLMVQVGDGCSRLLHEPMRNLECRRVQIDEIWCAALRMVQLCANPSKLARHTCNGSTLVESCVGTRRTYSGNFKLGHYLIPLARIAICCYLLRHCCCQCCNPASPWRPK